MTEKEFESLVDKYLSSLAMLVTLEEGVGFGDLIVNKTGDDILYFTIKDDAERKKRPEELYERLINYKKQLDMDPSEKFIDYGIRYRTETVQGEEIVTFDFIKLPDMGGD